MNWWIALGSFATGVVVGVAFDDALKLFIGDRMTKKAIHDERVRNAGPEARQRRNGHLTTVAAIALIIIAGLQAAVGVLLITTRSDVKAVSECQANYNQAFSIAYRARSDAANASRKQLNRVMTTVEKALRTQAPEDGRRFKRVLTAYVDAEAAYQERRRESPLPPLPDTYCER